MSPALKGLRRARSQVVELAVSQKDAVRRFERFQLEQCKGMHAHQLLAKAEHITPAYLPVWVFDLRVSAEWKGLLGFKDAGSGTMVWKEANDWRSLASNQQLSYADTPQLRVYASYKLPRDLGAGACQQISSELLRGARPLKEEEAAALCVGGRPQQQAQGQQAQAHGQEQQQAGASGGSIGGAAFRHAHQQQEQAGAVIQAPDMKQSVAYQLAWRALMQRFVAEAGKAAKEGDGAADVKDIHVRLQVHSRVARLLYVPAYVAHYQYGTRYKAGTSTVIVPQMFTALIGGTQQGPVIAQAHVSAIKTEVATAGAVSAVGLAGGDFASSLLGIDPLLPLGTVETVTLAVIAASLAGLWARGLPHAQRNKITAEQIRTQREFYRQYDARETKMAAAAAAAAAAGGPGAPFAPGTKAGELADEHMQWLWMDQDWRRWEGDEPWNWDEAQRRKAAEDLFKSIEQRRLERRKYVERLEEEKRRQHSEAETDFRRQRSSSSSSSRAGASRQGIAFGARSRSKRDFLGYYRVLELDVDAPGELSTEEVKAAFQKQAMSLHPDKRMGDDDEAKKEAHIRFQKVLIAYDVLRDPEKRAQYDSGQYMQ